MLQRTEKLQEANRKQVNEWRKRNLERRKEQERAAWHRRKAKVKAQKLVNLERALAHTLELIQN